MSAGVNAMAAIFQGSAPRRGSGRFRMMLLAGLLACMSSGPLLAAAPSATGAHEAGTVAPAIDEGMILGDPASPVGGNPKGDVTIVAFFDYNCPYCKKTDPVIEKLAKKDGNIRIIYKDLPILAESSVYGAQLALAAKEQGKYAQARRALMGLPAGKSDEAAMRQALIRAGVNMKRLDKDLKARGPDIMAYLRRNLEHARSLGLQGVPVYLIGPYKVAAALDEAGYAEVVKDARERAKGN